jgi:hypothetical protein
MSLVSKESIEFVGSGEKGAKLDKLVYNDSEVLEIEKEHFKGNNESEYFEKINPYPPSKVRIIVSPWSLCSNDQGKGIGLLVFLLNRVADFELHKTICKAWANRTRFSTLNVLFSLGLSPDPAVNLKVLEENKISVTWSREISWMCIRISHLNL